jgi:hypothetical protein
MLTTLKLFHGTSAAIAQELKKSGFGYTKTPALSFGDGCYFYDDADEAERFALEKHEGEAVVVVVELAAKSDRIKKMYRYELDEGGHKINQRAESAQSQVIDASTDDGIFVVRPISLSLIKILEIRVPHSAI